MRVTSVNKTQLRAINELVPMMKSPETNLLGLGDKMRPMPRLLLLLEIYRYCDKHALLSRPKKAELDALIDKAWEKVLT